MTRKSPIKVLFAPSPTEAVEFFRDGVTNRKVILLIGKCEVDYSGRAASKLEIGDRLVIVKEDGSVLVHRPKGYEPVNWQPPRCMFEAHIEGDKFVVRAIRKKPRESLKIKFVKVYLLSIMNLEDSGKFSLYASEEDMRQAILLKPSIVEEGLRFITYEKKVDPGFIDLYGIDQNGKLVVIEIKRRTAGKEAVIQLARYVESIRKSTDREIRGILVAPKLAKDVQRTLLSLGLDFKIVSPKKCAKILKKTEIKRKKLLEFI